MSGTKGSFIPALYDANGRRPSRTQSCATLAAELEITSTGDDNADWRADAAWAEQNDKVGQSQVDAYEKDGLTASGSATFANAWDSEDESIQGTFEISCAED